MSKTLLKATYSLCLIICSLLIPDTLVGQGFEGYYQHPNVRGNQIVFCAEGDVWTVPLEGGLARRLTTHAEQETNPAISPDGQTVAYTANYEGPSEVYTMPINGGLPVRWTFDGDRSRVNGWTPDGKVLYSTGAFAGLPDAQLVTLNLNSKEKTRVPLSNASEGSVADDGTVFFVNPGYHGNVTKRYKGGTARQIWKFTPGSAEAVKLTTDHPGGSHHPMWHSGRVYFITDRDGTMNIWSMNADGGDLKQHTKHADFDVRSASVSDGNIVYQLGADLWHYNISGNSQKKIDIKLVTDLDQLRERWVTNPSRYISNINPDSKGERVVITARGRVFVVPVNSGRSIEFTDKKDVRYRDATFSSDGKYVYTLSDESGEFEFIRLSANGMGSQKALTSNGKVLRYEGIPSPDGKWIAFDDLENKLFLVNTESGLTREIPTNGEGIGSFSWSPDSKWLAFMQTAANTMSQIFVYNHSTGEQFPITTDRANSMSPQWSPDGKFIYFLSDRSFTTIVYSPWGTRQPEPYFDASEKLYHIALKKGTRSPFRPDDELADQDKKEEPKTDSKKGKKSKGKTEEKSNGVTVEIEKEGILSRIAEVPIKPGNYYSLGVTKKAIYMMSRSTGVNASSSLCVVKIGNEDVKLKTMVDGANGFQLTGNREKILVSKSGSYYMISAGTGKVGNLSDSRISLSNWRFAITPKEDWKQLFMDAWRMERDYFYDKNMHGVNWQAMYDKYYPLLDRITTREELSDLIGRYVGELSALHTSVRGGDTRRDDKNITVADLGARFKRDEAAGGFKIEYIYKSDPDYPDQRSPLDDPYLDIREGDVVTAVNGRNALSALDIGELIRNQQGKQVRLTLSRNGAKRDAIVVPSSGSFWLRYRDWEYTRRLIVEEKSDDKVGYVHLTAMGSSNINQWYREFYPVFNRQGLIVDVRHNWGGNIDSFILEKLMRKAWMYWSFRSGSPAWNMQYAFRGHIVILVDENTASDGEAFADGFKKLGLGVSIGKRTWGGEIWLSGANRLSDGGIARAPMMGVYDENGNWLIEGHGFVPDIEVDNMPHATFNGSDAQLDAAIELLLKKIEEDPREVPQPPAFPDKSFENNR